MHKKFGIVKRFFANTPAQNYNTRAKKRQDWQECVHLVNPMRCKCYV
jgi:hypothetical protein